MRTLRPTAGLLHREQRAHHMGRRRTWRGWPRHHCDKQVCIRQRRPRGGDKQDGPRHIDRQGPGCAEAGRGKDAALFFPPSGVAPFLARGRKSGLSAVLSLRFSLGFDRRPPHAFNQGFITEVVAVSVVFVLASSHSRWETYSLLRDRQVVRESATGHHLLNILEGKEDAFLLTRTGTKKWDICAGAALLAEIGGRVTDCSGRGMDGFLVCLGGDSLSTHPLCPQARTFICQCSSWCNFSLHACSLRRTPPSLAPLLLSF